MDLPVVPPIDPMLGRLAPALPGPGWIYEPKWDGFRCIAFRSGDEIDLRSRVHSPLARYFPELVERLGASIVARYVVDGEILALRDGRPDFPALLDRLHPAESRVRRLSAETPAVFVAFDALAIDDADLRSQPFVSRRTALEEILGHVPPPVFVTPWTEDLDVASGWVESPPGLGIDGVIARDPGGVYRSGKRDLLKIKPQRTADCVVAGFRWHGSEGTVGSLLLGLYDGETMRHVGLVSSFRADLRSRLFEDVRPYVTSLEGHPWQEGFNVGRSPIGRLPGAASRWAYGKRLTWVPLRPARVCEVAYDHLEGERFRHPARWRRWRDDRDPRTCTYDQFATGDGDRPFELLATSSES